MTLITPAYTFTPGRSGYGTVNLSGIGDFDIKRLISITNQTHGIIIYQNDDPGLKFLGVTNKVITLLADTSYMNSSDTLQIEYDDGGGGASSGQTIVRSVSLVAPLGFAVSGSPVTDIGTLTIAYAAGYSMPLLTSQQDWNTAYSDRLKWDGGSDGLNAATARTSLGLGGAATLNVGTTANTVASGNDTRFTDLQTAINGKQPSGNYATLISGIVPNSQLPTYVASVAGKTGTVTLGKSDVGLENVDNTSDTNKPISSAVQTALNGKQKNITSGTAIPTGGDNGDIYLQYSL